jgi:large subunit ribosomal protein L17
MNRRGKLGRKSAHRNMMLRNMATSLFDKERIKTTLPKAKQLRPFAEKLITLACRQDLHARRQTLEYIQDKKVVKKLFTELVARFKDTKGGYTRIVPYRSRWGDGAELAYLELKDYKPAEAPKDAKEKKAKKKEPKEEAASTKKKEPKEAAAKKS